MATPLDAAKTQNGYNFGQQVHDNTQFNSDLSAFEGVGGDPTQSSFYKRMLSSGTDATAGAYNNVRSRRATQARMSGFGYASPIAQADDTALSAHEAGDLAQTQQQVGLQAYDAQRGAAGMRMQAAGQSGGLAANDLKVWNDAYQSEQQRKGAMWGKIANLGIEAAGAYATGGMSGLAKGMGNGGVKY